MNDLIMSKEELALIVSNKTGVNEKEVSLILEKFIELFLTRFKLI